jgi:hypothetical protein
LAGIMIFVGLHLGLLAWHTHRDRRLLNARGVHAAATIEGLGAPYHGITESYDPWTLKVSYTVSGTSYSNWLLNYPSQLTPARGDSISIIFDPADPRRAAIVGDTALKASLLCAWCWFALAATGAAASVVAVLGALDENRRWSGPGLIILLLACSLGTFAVAATLTDNGLMFPRHDGGDDGGAARIIPSPPRSAITRLSVSNTYGRLVVTPRDDWCYEMRPTR